MDRQRSSAVNMVSWKWVAAGAGIAILVVKFRMAGPRYRGKEQLDGKTVIVTGANTGIGLATAYELAKRHARVILACRDSERAEKAVTYIRSGVKSADVLAMPLDLASFASINDFAKAVLKSEKNIDILVNNAGVFQCPFSHTADGLEMQMGVNHMGHFLLTNLLLDRLKASAPSRVVVVSSGLSKLGHINFENLNSEKDYDKKKAYQNSKLANNLFARELAKRTQGSGISVHCLHPGMARTELGRHVPFPKVLKLILYPLYWLLVRSAWQASQTVLYCALNADLEGQTGKYYGNCKEEPWPENAQDDEAAARLWTISEKITRLK